MSVEKDFLEEDLLTLTRINELVKSIAHPHQVFILVSFLKSFFSIHHLVVILFIRNLEFG
jgi:hypothetical protein